MAILAALSDHPVKRKDKRKDFQLRYHDALEHRNQLISLVTQTRVSVYHLC